MHGHRLFPGRIAGLMRLFRGTDRDTKFSHAFDEVFNQHRPHRSLHLLPLNGRDPTPPNINAGLRRRDLLGGLIHEYEAA